MIKVGMLAALGASMFASANAAAGLSLYVPHNVNATDTQGATWVGTFEAPLTVSYNGPLEYAAFCVPDGKSCFVEPESEIVTGKYTSAKEVIAFDVGDMVDGDYSCYVATLLPKAMVCSEPEPFTVEAGRSAPDVVVTKETVPPPAPKEAPVTPDASEDGSVTAGVATFTPL